VPRYELKIRVTGKVANFECASEDELFELVRSELADQIRDTAGLGAVSAIRNYEAIEVVHARIEATIAHGVFKKRRGGIDVRRDGSAEAWLGRVTRTLIEPRPGEDLPAALRRELDSGT
jgi:hypothetical protein